MHKENQIRLGLMGTHIVMNLYFTHKLVFFSCQICYHSRFILCFEELRSYDEKIGQASNFTCKHSARYIPNSVFYSAFTFLIWFKHFLGIHNLYPKSGKCLSGQHLCTLRGCELRAADGVMCT